MNPTLVLHHSADLDGLCSRAIAHRALGDTADYVGWDYGQDVPDLAPYSRVYVIDISLPPATMSANAEKIVWLDHHATAIKSCPSYLAGTRIDGVAACRLAWQWFNGDRKATKQDYVDRKVMEPRAVQLLGEFDIWDKHDPETDPFQYGAQAEKSPRWDAALCLEGTSADGDGLTPSHYVDQVVDRGRAVLNYLDTINAKLIADRGFDVDFEGRRFLALNISIKGSMQFASGIKPEHDGCLAFSWNGKGWGCSLYGVDHKRDLDLSPIAVKHGGGGHPGACGFLLDKLPKELGGT